MTKVSFSLQYSCVVSPGMLEYGNRRLFVRSLLQPADDPTGYLIDEQMMPLTYYSLCSIIRSTVLYRSAIGRFLFGRQSFKFSFLTS